VEILSEEGEGRLAFLGAVRTLGERVDGDLGVVDVGGGSSEVAIGTAHQGARVVRSFAIGSGSLADAYLSGDPPSAAELEAIRAHLARFFESVELERPRMAIAVGGSATSLRRLVGPVLEKVALDRALGVLAGARIAAIARRYELDPARVRILPAGVLLLEAVSRLLGRPLRIANGGLREGVILELLEGAADG
jgi:exopolyphosphatase/guanosine-5'-triphosphate,3'-diphosphate pyrophosphatase